MRLPDSFLKAPIAHRGLHDLNNGRAENGMKAFEAAINAGYGIELDLQRSKDGIAMVFHDYDLGRLTDETGAFAQRSAAELSGIPLKGDGDGIPTLDTVLEFVDGRVPLLIEVKDQDGILGPNVGLLEDAAASALRHYQGDFAVMSFNPHSVACFVESLPDVPRGLVTEAFDIEEWMTVPKARCTELQTIPDFERVGACFISHDVNDLDRQRVAEIKKTGANVLCWTVRSIESETAARRYADNITFEGYLA